ncbi:MAG: HAMP domain-containing sensor histidine kinase [Azospirillaceae bacterium]|nr:HAMP domain-containing sensor histidine kinase [Azospirillaceae bacterium]
MLDYHTALVLTYALVCMDGVIAVVVWQSQKRLIGMELIAASYMLPVVAVGLIAHREPLTMISGNVLYNLSEALAAEGMAIFLRQPRLPGWVLPATALGTLVLWTAAAIWFPDNIQLRNAVSTIITLACVCRMIALLMRDRGQPVFLRRVTLACLGLHGTVCTVRLGAALQNLVTGRWVGQLLPEQVLPLWYVLELAVYTNLLFFCLLAMFCGRLAENLRARDRDLWAEQEKQIRLSETLATERRLHQEQREFLHLLSHEFGTPLAVIDRSAEMLQMQVGEEPPEAPRTGAIRGRLDTIRATVRRLSHLVEDLLRAEQAGLETARRDRLDAGALARQAVAAAYNDAHGGAKGWEDGRVRLDITDGPAAFLGDADMMVMAIANLVANGLKYSPADQAVTVTLKTSPATLTLTVRDRGIGFPPAELATVGQRFFRASNARTHTGTGLGLYLVKIILAKHGGQLDLANHPDGGAVAILRLPAAGAAPRPIDPIQPAALVKG